MIGRWAVLVKACGWWQWRRPTRMGLCCLAFQRGDRVLGEYEPTGTSTCAEMFHEDRRANQQVNRVIFILLFS